MAGVLLMGVAVMLFDPAASTPLHRLVLPLTMAAAAWLMVQNVVAVLLGGVLLAAIHADHTDPDWIIGRAYPALAILGGAALGYIGLRRFQARIEATREERWARRKK